MSTATITIEDFFPLPDTPKTRRIKWLLIRPEDEVGILCGQSKISNIPAGCVPWDRKVNPYFYVERVKTMLVSRERWHDYGLVGVIIEHSSFDPVEVADTSKPIIAKVTFCVP
jgi:hypothetical protein